MATSRWWIWTASMILAPASQLPAAPPLPLIPMPATVVRHDGSFVVAEGATIAASDPQARTAARLLAERVRVERGLTLRPGPVGAIRFDRDASIAGEEAYRLTVDASGIRVSASGPAGLVHGAMTLAQLLSPDRAFGQPVAVPALAIDDAPRFRWRGVMIDPTRHFEPIGFLYTIVDQMAALKLNTLHLHLSDDQGWRVEIKRYPKLTSIGAWRVPPSAGGPPAKPVGGFYTQAELKALVAYASARAITIVPEIDLPGHAQALVAAYPELGVFGDRPAVGHDWGVNPYLFDPGPKGVAFVEQVLDELMAIFPGTYIHLGGDEAVKDQWERSPRVQAQIKALGLKDENALQSWMIDRFGTYLAAHGRRLIGWDEILEGGLPPSASIMSWRGDKGAVEAASAGHDVVLTPGVLYIDNLQSDRPDEQPGRLAITTLADVYAYDPTPKGLDADKAGHVLGAQVNAWSEYLVTPEQVEHAVFPRAAALAELTWSPRQSRDLPGFLARVDPLMARYARAGIAAADTGHSVGFVLQGPRGEALKMGRAVVTMKTQLPYGTIRYTLNGTAPTPASMAYAGPVTVTPGATIRAAAFADGHSVATPRGFDTSRAALLTWGPSDAIACPKGKFGLRVPLDAEQRTIAPAFNVNIFDTCTQYPDTPLDIASGFTVDVARLPRHYGLAHEASALRAHYAVTAHGELVIRAGGCDGAVVASFPLPDPATAPQRLRFAGPIVGGRGDSLCMLFTAPLDGPFYTVERLRLEERTR